MPVTMSRDSGAQSASERSSSGSKTLACWCSNCDPVGGGFRWGRGWASPVLRFRCRGSEEDEFLLYDVQHGLVDVYAPDVCDA